MPCSTTVLRSLYKPAYYRQQGYLHSIGPTTNPIMYATKSITLNDNQSVFSIEYVALSYTSSQKNKYAYKLVGFEKDWNYVATKREATYTNLDPGDYTFRVKASNNDGVWNEQGVALN